MIYATLSSIAARPVIAGGYFSILERFGAYAVLGFLFHWPIRAIRCLCVCILLFGGAVALELMQNLVSDRDPRLLDAVEKLLGGAVGLVSGGIFQSIFMPKLYRKRPTVRLLTVSPVSVAAR